MATYQITPYYKSAKECIQEFEDALHHSARKYSLRNLSLTGIISNEEAITALHKSMRICTLAGENSKNHFRQIYIFNTDTGEMNKDWLMSKKGFNMLMMQHPSINEKIARWLWRFSDL